MKTPLTWEEGLDAVLAEMRAVMVERQNKYGPSNILQQGLLGVLTRVKDDKMERIGGALNGKVVRGRVVLDPITGFDAEDTFEDGCVDAANYIGPIMLMLHRGWWTLPRDYDGDGPVPEREARLARIAEVYPEAAAEARLAGLKENNP